MALLNCKGSEKSGRAHAYSISSGYLCHNMQGQRHTLAAEDRWDYLLCLTHRDVLDWREIT